MKITRTQLGRLLGYALLLVLVNGLAWLATAWVMWEANPGAWTMPMRATFLGFVVFICLVQLVRSSITIVVDEERR